jgi:SAM-dependent methyltransferase
MTPLDIYCRALEEIADRPGSGSDHGWRVRYDDGAHAPLALDRFLGPVEPEEFELLLRLPAPVLDVGCGPGRHLRALAEAGVPALGIDIAPAALHLAGRDGAPTLRCSVFGPVPMAGRWGSALLLDGNIGIGGNPAALLRRVCMLLRPEGHLIVEVTGPLRPSGARRARLEGPDGCSDWFPWARVSVDAIAALAAVTGFRVHDVCGWADRSFAHLVRARVDANASPRA